MIEINPQVWYGERCLKTIPVHFIKATTPLTSESLYWVKSKLSGRFAVTLESDIEFSQFIHDTKTYVYFEDSADAMIYELRWAGSK